MIRPKQIQTSDDETRRLQESLTEALVRLQTSNPLLNGVFVEKVIATTDTTVQHSLGYEPTGFLVVGRDADATVWKSSTANSRPQDRLILKATATVTVTLYVF